MKKITIYSSIFLLFIAFACNQKDKKQSSQKKILFVLTSHDQLGNTDEKTGYWLSEVSHPWHVFTKAGYTIDFVSPKGGKVPMDPRSNDTNDSINNLFLNDNFYRQKMVNTMQPNEINKGEYEAIFYAGGHGTMWDFPNNTALSEITSKIYENGGVVGAVCHGPAGIVNVKLSNGKYLVNGKKVSAFTNKEETALKLDTIVPFSLEDQLVKNGAIMQKADMWHEKVSVDQGLVTGQNPQSAKAVGMEMLKLLKNK
ncbi:type 1 glutamine amidotransferase domain-containing protein [Marinifilum breve]|uniref:Type 1 glutamine amidotransferase domain-containing protein n=1 Tax=Marinifilum breve TaxID=2184082 RepID=A0A2V4A3Q5_9BACT|nr:type 1 glutamine amidotransferase domain-containing protein [Marinifilum breve]PXY01980.1 type 1 glutamine amidotransferase domain-containing protein [Marinifilum breve]